MSPIPIFQAAVVKPVRGSQRFTWNRLDSATHQAQPASRTRTPSGRGSIQAADYRKARFGDGNATSPIKQRKPAVRRARGCCRGIRSPYTRVWATGCSAGSDRPALEPPMAVSLSARWMDLWTDTGLRSDLYQVHVCPFMGSRVPFCPQIPS